MNRIFIHYIDKYHKNCPMNSKVLFCLRFETFGPRLALDWNLSPVCVLRRPSLSSLCPRWDSGGRRSGSPPLSVAQSHIAIIIWITITTLFQKYIFKKKQLELNYFILPSFFSQCIRFSARCCHSCVIFVGGFSDKENTF